MSFEWACSPEPTEGRKRRRIAKVEQGPPARAPAGRRPRVPYAGGGTDGPKDGEHAGVRGGRPSAAPVGRAGGGVPGGIQGRGEGLEEPVPAPAVRPGRVRRDRPARAGADR